LNVVVTRNMPHFVSAASKFGKGTNPRTSVPQNEPVSIPTVTKTGIPGDMEKAGIA